MLKFVANLSFLFSKESASLVERYRMAKQFGFRWVECAFPYGVSSEDLKKVKQETGLEQILINTFPGDTTKGQFGFAALPGKQKEFRESLDLSIKYAQALDCKRVHVMSGCHDGTSSHEDMEKTYIENIAYAAEHLGKHDIQALIEPINQQYTIPNYFMCNPQKAFDYINQLKHPNLKLQLDIFHLQILEGNLTSNIEKYWPLVGHIQVAQAPRRLEPFAPGEIDYQYVFGLLSKTGYNGFIGLEHNCSGDTSDALEWLKVSGHEF